MPRRLSLIQQDILEELCKENGISLRFLGSSSQEARKCFFCIWKQIRSVCGFCEPKYQGVWPLQDSMNY